jgi:putative DNA primase/helicase
MGESETASNPYRGLDRIHLQKILLTTKGKPDYPDQFREAWNETKNLMSRGTMDIPLPYNLNYPLQFERNKNKLCLPPGWADIRPRDARQPIPQNEMVYEYRISPVSPHLLTFRNREEVEAIQTHKTHACLLFGLSDVGNAQRLVHRFGKDLRYCYQTKSWYVFDGTVWKEDSTGLVYEIAKYTAIKIIDESEDQISSQRAIFAGKSLAKARIESMIGLAESTIPILIDTLDSNPYLLSLPNGIIDLKKWEFREHRRDDFVTMIAGAAYDPDATCPIWEAHLMKIFDGDKWLISELQEYFGYILSGENLEEILLIAYGSGSNGKSVTKEILSFVLGDYAKNAAPETLMTRKDNSAPRPDIARLRGARFIAVNEGEVTSRFSEGTIKSLTSPDRITARELFQKEIEFTMSGLIFFATNHKPRVFGQDYAIWRRLKLIPFTHTIDDQEKDLSIKEKLRGEASGILNWLLTGYRRYIDRGRLPKSQKIDAASKAYKQESDVLGEFLSGYIISGEDQDVIPRSDLFNSYKLSLDTSEKPIQKRMFNDMIRERLGREEIQIKGKGWCWSGIHAKESKQGTLT